MSKTDVLHAFMEEVWNQQQTDKIGAYLAPAYTIHRDAGDPWEGKVLTHENFLERLQLSFGPFPDIHFEITATIEEATCVAISWIMTGTNLGPVAGFPPTGKPIRTTGMTFSSVLSPAMSHEVSLVRSSRSSRSDYLPLPGISGNQRGYAALPRYRWSRC